jgi:hypothetical protein
VPASGELDISSHAPLTVSWVVPTLDACTTQRIWLYLFEVVGQGRVGSVSCHWPISAGQGTVPRQLLRALSEQIQNPGTAAGAISIFAGDVAEVTTGTASYTLVTTDDDPDGDGVGVAADGPVSTNFNLTE